jgi:hypothetical protein
MSDDTARPGQGRLPPGRMRSGLGAARQFLRPGPRAWRGAAYGVAALALVLLLRQALDMRPWPPLFALWALVLFLLTAALANLVIDELLPKLPPLFRNLAIGALVVFILMMLGSVAVGGQLAIALALLLAGALLGGGVAALAGSRAGERGAVEGGGGGAAGAFSARRPAGALSLAGPGGGAGGALCPRRRAAAGGKPGATRPLPGGDAGLRQR